MTDKLSQGFDLTGRVAVVTGAARGIGQASAALLAEAGATVVLTDVLAPPLEAAAATIRDAGGSAEGVVLDVSDKEAVERLADDVVARHGRLDAWVNCAAIIIDVEPLTMTEEHLDRIFAVNFKGTVFGCQAAGRHMLAQGSGSIVNFTSGAVDMPTPTHIPYATTKAAVAQLSRSLAAAWGAQGVRVNTVAPGWTDTPMNERHVLREDGTVDPDRKAAYVATMSRIGVLGVPGDPYDQAYAVLYLVSPAGRFVTGQVMRPNGGATMPW
jgi:3-oxoacyl-[acyl-carrier protein] reductase